MSHIPSPSCRPPGAQVELLVHLLESGGHVFQFLEQQQLYTCVSPLSPSTVAKGDTFTLEFPYGEYIVLLALHYLTNQEAD